MFSSRYQNSHICIGCNIYTAPPSYGTSQVHMKSIAGLLAMRPLCGQLLGDFTLCTFSCLALVDKCHIWLYKIDHPFKWPMRPLVQAFSRLIICVSPSSIPEVANIDYSCILPRADISKGLAGRLISPIIVFQPSRTFLVEAPFVGSREIVSMSREQPGARAWAFSGSYSLTLDRLNCTARSFEWW